MRRRLRPLAYFMSLLVLGAATWMPRSVYAQVIPAPGGGAGASLSANNTWTGIQTFTDDKFLVVDNGDATKRYLLELSGVTTGNDVTETASGTTAAPVLTLTGGTYRASAGFTGASTGTFCHTSGAVTAGADTCLHRLTAGVAFISAGAANQRKFLMGGGADVASAATLPAATGSVFHVTGTTGITNLTTSNLSSGAQFCMIFDGALTLTDGGNMKIAGNFTTTADDVLCVVYDGTNFHETSRSVN